ncbi:MAG: OmpA family protein, partial [Pseudomonadota bacterium]
MSSNPVFYRPQRSATALALVLALGTVVPAAPVFAQEDCAANFRNCDLTAANQRLIDRLKAELEEELEEVRARVRSEGQDEVQAGTLTRQELQARVREKVRAFRREGEALIETREKQIKRTLSAEAKEVIAAAEQAEEAARAAAARAAARRAEREAEERAAARAAERQAEREAEERAAARQAERQAEREAEERAAARQAERQAEREAEERAAARQAERQAEREAEERAAARQAERQAERAAEERAAARQAERQAEREAEARATARAEERQEEREREAVEAALREERRMRRQAQRRAAVAVDALRDGSASPSDEVTVVVTDATARSSSQDSASSNDDGGIPDIVKILGGAAVGFAIGSILSSGDEVVEQSGDRVVVNRDGELVVLKDENSLLRRPGSEVATQTFSDGSSRTVVAQPGGGEVVTVRAVDGTILYRSARSPSGVETVLIDETRAPEVPIEISRLGTLRATGVDASASSDAALRTALFAGSSDRAFSLRQIREVEAVRSLAPPIDLDNITFPTNSAVIARAQADKLSSLGLAIADLIASNPDEVFLIEGHTDTVGADVYNLTLSDRRAESVALALVEYFDVP